jgi:hypothetical protein
MDTRTTTRSPTGTAGTPGSAGGATDVAKDRGKQVASSAADQAKNVTDTAKEQVEVVATEARDHVQQLAHRTKDELRAQADERAGQLSNTLRDVGGQLRSLSEGNAQEGMVSDLSRDLSHRVQGFADRIDDGGVEGILDDVKRAARRRRGIFLVGAAAAGFVVARAFRDLQDVSSDGDQPHHSDGSHGAPIRATAPPVGSIDPLGGPAVMPLSDPALGTTPPPVTGSPLRSDGAS